ncbi:Vacuolar-sorting receptor 6 [Acorus calamus]|uniref:Vacuolar-sorting receptor 6 n=1 Tax=Acorus calamus TaxID=4465 RepID=A0AAV9FHL2_ACOCL|nr:Vacuolar-sorting receptor 6 [Acorus calamus]
MGRFVVEKSSITVLSPENFRSRHDAAIGNFGIPEYGASMTGVVVYPEKSSTGCEDFGERFRSLSSRPVVLLLDRGDCYFALKAWHGQKAGAAAVLVADNIDEPLITMGTPHESSDEGGYIERIKIPSALVNRAFGETLKKALRKASEEVVVKLDWSDSMPNPDERVEYELWTNSNDECGLRCDEQIDFVKNFKGHAQILERGGYTQFRPHYITWFCPTIFIKSRQCRSQCINNGRYCAPDPEQNFHEGYEGKDVVIENLRQLCVHKVANESNRSWVWWDFVTDFHIRCSMKEKKYSRECAESVVKSLGLPLEKIKDCMGDLDADVENSVLKAEQELQVSSCLFFPYRGLQWILDRTAILKAICAGFKAASDPAICLSSDIETNECLENNGGCWQDTRLNITACKDTYRGKICQCPTANGVQYHGDGYTSCKAVGPGRCAVDNGGCWSETRDGRTLSACNEYAFKECHCPYGFYGDGYKCEAKNASRFGWFMTLLVLSCVAGAAIAGYVFYKYRLRSYMDSEIMAIMSQYMPLDNPQHEAQPLRQGIDVKYM